MTATDSRIDDYIAKSADFAKPILTRLRATVHAACPTVNETIKWGFPNFVYNGQILCSMASFKQHCTFGFWLASLMKDPDKILATVGEKASMGHLGPMKSMADLPDEKVLIKYIKEAMLISEQGNRQKKEKVSLPKEIGVPDYFSDALKQDSIALLTFEKFSSSHKKEYVEWITDAKTEATRQKRIAAAIEMLREGKSRNWKYNKS